MITTETNQQQQYRKGRRNSADYSQMRRINLDYFFHAKTGAVFQQK